MINWVKATTTKITDFNIGSAARTMLEAPAAEIDELYQQMFIGLREAIPVSVYNSFDFAAEPATSASGLVRVTVTAGTPVLVSAGTVLSVEGKAVTYTIAADITIASGATYADAQVSASDVGSVGNLASGADFTLSPAPDRFVSATNLSPFVNGRDAEQEDERKLRFNAFIASLNRGTVAALTYGMKTATVTDSAGNVIERVVGSAVVEPWIDDALEPISLVKCYIHNGVGSTSSALVLRAREVIYGYYDTNGVAVPGWKAAGVKVDVFAATEQAINVTGVVTTLDGYDSGVILDAVEQIIYTYLIGLDIGVPAIKAEIIALVMEIDGVYNFVASALADEVSALANVKLMPGTITLSTT